MSQRFLCPQGHHWSIWVDGCETLPLEWIVCPLCGSSPEPGSQTPQAGDTLTPSQRLARASDPDAQPGRPWSRRSGLWPVFLGGFILLIILPVLVWVGVVHWQQRAAEMQHLRDVEQELQEHRAAEQRALEALARGRAELEAHLARSVLQPLQTAPPPSDQELDALRDKADGKK
jgi:hypothetical protein